MTGRAGDDDLSEIIGEFLVESREGLDHVDQLLVELEQEPGDRERLSSVFRALHTIKGNSGFLGFDSLQALAHAAESLLSRLRDGELVLDPPTTSVLLQTMDAVRDMLAAIERDGQEGRRDDARLIAALHAITAGEAPATGAPTRAGRVARTAPRKARAATTEPAAARATPQSVTAVTKGEAGTATELEEQQEQTGERATVAGSSEEDSAESPPIAEALPVPASGTPATARSPRSETEPPADGDRLVSRDTAVANGSGDSDARSPLAEPSVRVDVAVLDRLVNLVGELVLARNQIVQRATRGADSDLVATAQRLDLVTSELQDGVMKTRMQPIATVWSRFPRVVRDLALTCHKQVRLDMEGTETELDRTILEAIRDPMLHLVRNAVDHGLEAPEDRVAAGKPAEGRILLRAYHEGGYVNIEIADDGKGIDVERVRAKAMAGEHEPERLNRLRSMSERDVINLVFAPGLSTAAEVTSVSGRGVGMDIVKTHVERIGGTIEVATVAGRGTTLKVRLPLTLAIVPALIVSCVGQRYAIPQGSIVELVRLEGQKVASSIEQVAGASVYRLRGQLLPLVDLGTILARGTSSPPGEPVTIVVLQVGTRRFGLIVTSVSDTQEIVVKPLDPALADVRVFSGATIMGDGGVALILEVSGVASRAGILGGDQQSEVVSSDGAEANAERRSLLVLGAGGERRVAIPLEDVNRLEQVSASAIERAECGDVLQYRGEILRLLPLATLFGGAHADGDELPVVVTRVFGEPVGLVASEIIDIVEDVVDVKNHASRRGLSGSAIVAGRITDLLDLRSLVETLAPDLVRAAAVDLAQAS